MSYAFNQFHRAPSHRCCNFNIRCTQFEMRNIKTSNVNNFGLKA